MYFPKQHSESIVPEKSGILKKGLVHHFSRNYCIMTSLKRRCNVFDVILYDKGRNSVEQNAIVHDNSDRSLLRPQAPLLQSPNVVNQ